MTIKTTKILHKRGIEQNMPKLDASEIGFSTDTSKVFVGSNAGNIELAKQTSVNSAITLAQEAKQQASDGKTKIATALTGKGVSATSSDTFDVLANKIKGMVGKGSLISSSSLIPAGDIYPTLKSSFNIGNIRTTANVQVDDSGNSYIPYSYNSIAKISYGGSIVWTAKLNSIGEMLWDGNNYIYANYATTGIARINTSTGSVEILMYGEYLLRYGQQMLAVSLTDRSYCCVDYSGRYVTHYSKENQIIKTIDVGLSTIIAAIYLDKSDLYVADKKYNLSKYDSNGNKIWSISSNTYSFATLATHSASPYLFSTRGSGGEITVINKSNGAISNILSNGENKVSYIAVDKNNNLLVSSTANGVSKYDINGKIIFNLPLVAGADIPLSNFYHEQNQIVTTAGSSYYLSYYMQLSDKYILN